MQVATISTVATSLQGKISEIMKKIESSTSLQNISALPAGMKRGKVRRAKLYYLRELKGKAARMKDVARPEAKG